jgi:xanthine dehydrogenase large subunit
MRSLIKVNKADISKADANKGASQTAKTNNDKAVVNGQGNIGLGGVGRSKKHESADKHVAGDAIYVDDRPALRGELHAAVGQSAHAHATILSMDLSAVKAAEGVVAVITVEDVPGHTDIGPVFPGDPVLAIDKVEFVGQPLFAVAATSYDLARKAVKLAKVEYQALEAVLTVKEALAKQSFVRPPFTMKRGDSDAAIAGAAHQLSGEIVVGGQEHMYLEGQVSTAVPNEDGGMNIYTSSQHPS